MKTNLKALAGLVLASAVVAGHAQTATPSVHAAKKKAAPAKPSVESQIEALREQMNSQNSQIQALRQQLADRDSQLQQAQQAAQQAQAAATQAQQAAQTQQAALTDNTQAVNSLQSSVSDLKLNTQSIVSTVQDQQSQVKKAIESPSEIHFKGVTLSPTGSFIAAETVWRGGATGGDINTQFNGVPLNHSNAAQLSEFYGTARQSRLALRATAKLDNMKLTGYYEADWLSAGSTSNDNQSNSYTMRQRQIWGQASLNNGWQFTAGQMWSLATETGLGLDPGTEVLPSTIDSQYAAGFVWERQYAFRATKNFHNRFWVGAAAENPETLNPAGSSLPLNLVIGSAGNAGGLYNPGNNYSFNLAPDIIAKMAFEPKFGGHFEVFGISRFFRDRVYPNASAAPPAGSTSLTGTSAGAYNDSTVGGGIGGSFRYPFLQKKLTVGLKGLYGMGTGRYGSSTIADITLRPDGQIAPLRNFDAIGTLEANVIPRLTLYFNYGGDYVYRRYFGKVGYGSPLTNMSGCRTEPLPGGAPNANGGTGFSPSNPSNCGNQTKNVQEFVAGYWYDLYRGERGRLRQGIQFSYFQRLLWSGDGGTINPDGAAYGSDPMWWTSFRYYLP